MPVVRPMTPHMERLKDEPMAGPAGQIVTQLGEVGRAMWRRQRLRGGPPPRESHRPVELTHISPPVGAFVMPCLRGHSRLTEGSRTEPMGLRSLECPAGTPSHDVRAPVEAGHTEAREGRRGPGGELGARLVQRNAGDLRRGPRKQGALRARGWHHGLLRGRRPVRRA